MTSEKVTQKNFIFFFVRINKGWSERIYYISKENTQTCPFYLIIGPNGTRATEG